MIAVCVPVTSWDQYERYALPGIQRLVEARPDTLVLARESAGSYQRAANLLLSEAAATADLEGAVVIHQDVELLNANAANILPRRFRDEPRLAIVGSIGGLVRSGLNWGAGDPRGTRIELPEGYDAVDLASGFCFVAALDGVLLALSPWATRTLRFDLRFEDWFHGYDIDLCLQARSHGRLVAVDDLPIRHFQTDGFRNGRGADWIEAEREIRSKWDVGVVPDGLLWTRGPAPSERSFG
jgi:hypothetical protein